MMTLRDEIDRCLAEAQAHGYDGTAEEYVLTDADCDAIVDALGRRPTREEWLAEGYYAFHCAEDE